MATGPSSAQPPNAAVEIGLMALEQPGRLESHVQVIQAQLLVFLGIPDPAGSITPVRARTAGSRRRWPDLLDMFDRTVGSELELGNLGHNQ